LITNDKTGNEGSSKRLLKRERCGEEENCLGVGFLGGDSAGKEKRIRKEEDTKKGILGWVNLILGHRNET